MESLIAPQCLLYPLKAPSREQAFNHMLDELIRQGTLPQDLRAETLAALETRESRLTTAIGNRIALPHATISGIPSVITMAAGSPDGIEFDASDQQPVHILFMVLIPSDQYSTHLRAIAGVTRFFRQDGIVERLVSAADPEEFRQCFL